MKVKQHILTTCSLIMLSFWISIVLHHVVHFHHNFHILLQESLPYHWEKEIFWILFICECVCLTLLILGAFENPRTNKIKPWGFALSTFLLFGFTLYICLSMWNWYIHRPCNCPGFFAYLNWNNRMVCNSSFLIISIVGWWWSRSTAGGSRQLPTCQSSLLKVIRYKKLKINKFCLKL